MNIEFIKRRLLFKYPFFGSVIANVKIIMNNNCYSNGIPTLATDGETIYYHEKAMENLTPDEQLFMLAHEICHIAFNHVSRSKGKIPKLWNQATDAVINAFLKQDGLPLVKGVIDIPESINYDAEELYKMLLENEKLGGESSLKFKQKESGAKCTNDSSLINANEDQKEIYDVGHDTHSMWASATSKQEQTDKEDAEKDNKSTFLLEDKIKNASKLGEKKSFKLNEEIRKKKLEDLRNDQIKRLEELRKKLTNMANSCGHSSSGEKRKLTEIGTANPIIDWRRVLKEAVRYDVDWSYQNADIEDGIVTPYLEEMPRPETEIVLDTSGSVNETLLKNFLRECKNILKISLLKVGCFDTKFYGFTEIKNVEDIDKLTFTGGGGTDFEVAVNAFSRRVENKIIFTDGKASMPLTSIDAIWIVFGDKKIKPKGGKVINIDGEQLHKLMNPNTLDSRSFMKL